MSNSWPVVYVVFTNISGTLHTQTSARDWQNAVDVKDFLIGSPEGKIRPKQRVCSSISIWTTPHSTDQMSRREWKNYINRRFKHSIRDIPRKLVYVRLVSSP